MLDDQKRGGAADVEASGVIRKLLASEVALVREHLLRLEADARHRRFGHDVADSYLERYAASVVAPGNVAYGYLCDGQLRALAELKKTGSFWATTAEAAFSVEREFANRGLATALMGRIIRSARNRRVRHLLLYCMADNAKMQAIARRHSADLRFEDGSIIADIEPASRNCMSIAQEFVDDRFSLAHSVLDYQSRVLRAS